jgi:hypothetical protein
MLTGLADEGPGFAAAWQWSSAAPTRAAESSGQRPGRFSPVSTSISPSGTAMRDSSATVSVPRSAPRHAAANPGPSSAISAARVGAALDHCRAWVDDIVVDVAASLERDEEIVSDLDGPRRNAATHAALAAADRAPARRRGSC